MNERGLDLDQMEEIQKRKDEIKESMKLTALNKDPESPKPKLFLKYKAWSGKSSQTKAA